MKVIEISTNKALIQTWKFRLKSIGLSQKELAKMVDSSSTHLSTIISGKTHPNSALVDDVEAVLKQFESQDREAAEAVEEFKSKLDLLNNS